MPGNYQPRESSASHTGNVPQTSEPAPPPPSHMASSRQKHYQAKHRNSFTGAVAIRCLCGSCLCGSVESEQESGVAVGDEE